MAEEAPIGKSIVRSTKVGNEIAVNLLDLEAAAVRCERSYEDPELRWRAFRSMLEGLRQGMEQITTEPRYRRPDRD